MLKNWHAIYTKSRTEKKVCEALAQSGYEVYLPMHKVARKWSDRIKIVELPLISSYVFVHVDESEYYDVLNTNGVVAYVTFEGKAAKIPEKQIVALKQSLTGELPVELSTERIKPGQAVEIIAGPLKGMRGNVLTEAGNTAFIINMHSIGFVFKVTLGAHDIREIK